MSHHSRSFTKNNRRRITGTLRTETKKLKDADFINIADKDIKAKEVLNRSGYKRLVLAGGGLRGLAYIGAINALRKLNLLSDLKEILGCSIGSVFALLIILNFSDDELHDFLLHFHYDKIKDIDFFKIMTEWGVESGSKIENYLVELIHKKTGLNNPSFIELFNHTGVSLIVNAVALDEYECHYFNHKLSPNMKVVKAIRASIAVPGLFTPVHYDNHVYVDGGLLNNFPIEFFEGSNSNEVLGLCFDMATKPPGLKGLNTINTYVNSVMGCVLARIDRLNMRVSTAERRLQFRSQKYPKIIVIPTGEITAFQSTMDRTRRLFLYHQGEQSVIEAFRASTPFSKENVETRDRSSNYAKEKLMNNALRRKSI